MGKISFIASELAKKDMKFKDEDRGNQNKLLELMQLTKEYEQTVREKTEFIVATIKENNPELAKKEDLYAEVLYHMELGIQNKEIESIEQLSAPEMISRTEQKVTTSEKTNDEKYNSDSFDNEMSNILGASLITGTVVLTEKMISDVLSGRLSSEQLDNLEKAIVNSKEVKDKTKESTEALSTGNATQENLNFLNAKKDKKIDYFANNKTDNAKRGALLIVGTLNEFNIPELEGLAQIRSAQYGISDLVYNEKNEFDFDLYYNSILEVTKGNPQLLERYSTPEKLKAEIKKIAEGKAESLKKEIEKIKTSKKYQELPEEERETELQDYIMWITGGRMDDIKARNEAAKTGNIEKIEQIRENIPLLAKFDFDVVTEKILEFEKSKQTNIEEKAEFTKQPVKEMDTDELRR